MSKRKISALDSNVIDNDNFCSTQTKFRTSRLKWTIENYDVVSKTIKELKSPEFPFGGKENKKWYIEFESPEINKDLDTEPKIILKRTFTEEIYVHITFSLETTFTGSYSFDFNKILPENEHVFWTVPSKKLAKALHWDKITTKTLIATCKIQTLESTMLNFAKEKSVKVYKSPDLIGDMLALFDDQSFKDISFSVQGEEFTAHKTILAARSPVFAAMFTHEMSEQVTSNVEIVDMKPDIFKKMLRFIYTDKIDDLEESAPELLAAAEKYDLKRLKEICIEIMHEKLSTENFLEILHVADLYSINDLKKEAWKFVISQRELVIKMEEFKALIKSRPHLAIELVEAQDESLNHQEIVKNVTNASLELEKGDS